MNQQLLAAVIFLITYAIIVSERIHRTTAALLGGMLMIVLGVVPQDEVFRALDLNVIFLLAGMMMIAYMLGQTGLFQWLAVKSVILGKGNPLAYPAENANEAVTLPTEGTATRDAHQARQGSQREAAYNTANRNIPAQPRPLK